MSDEQPDELDLTGGPGLQRRSALATDPICGMTVDPTEADYQLKYGGRDYYFCSTHCLDEFQADPALYEGWIRRRGTPAEHRTQEDHPHRQGATYTCPMHPEVVQDKPGSCPKCGMDLEPR